MNGFLNRQFYESSRIFDQHLIKQHEKDISISMLAFFTCRNSTTKGAYPGYNNYQNNHYGAGRPG